MILTEVEKAEIASHQRNIDYHRKSATSIQIANGTADQAVSFYQSKIDSVLKGAEAREQQQQIIEINTSTDNVDVIPTVTPKSNISPLLIIGGLILGAVLITK